MSLENRIEELTAAVKTLTAQMQGANAPATKTCCSDKPEAVVHKAEVVKPVEQKVEAPAAEVADPLAELKLPNGKIAKRFLELSNGGKGRDQQAALLKQFGAKTVKDVKAEDIDAFAEALEAAFAAAEEERYFALPEPVVEENPPVLEGELMDKDYDKPFEAGSPEFDDYFDRTDGILSVPYIKAGIEKQKILCAQFGIAKLSLLPRGRVDEMLKAIEAA